MRVVVTGGAGFIGQHIVRHYAAEGHETFVIDDLSKGSKNGLPPTVEILETDISTPQSVEVLTNLRPDLVIHGAAQVSVVRSMEDPARDRAVNLVGTAHMLRGANTARHFVFVSSGGAIYGDSPFATEELLPRPESFYGIHKWAAERYVERSGLSYAIARLANVYGPGQRADLEGGVIASFCKRAREMRALTIYGDGEQRRDFVHVDDVVRAIRAMADRRAQGIWNIGSGLATSINEVATLVETAADRRLEREHAPERAGELRVSCLDASAARRDLGWSAAVTLAEGVRDLV